MIFPPQYLIRNKRGSRRAIGDSPGVEACRHIDMLIRTAGTAYKRKPIHWLKILIDPAILRLVDTELPANKLLQLQKQALFVFRLTRLVGASHGYHIQF